MGATKAVRQHEAQPRAKALGLRHGPHSSSGADARAAAHVVVDFVRTAHVISQAEAEERAAGAFDAILTLLSSDPAWSNRAVARRLGVDERIVRDYRRGERRIPSDVWERIGRSVSEPFIEQLLARVRGG